MDKVILHCDLNNFYASVETLLNPELRGKPVAVCGDPKKRHGIVLAKIWESSDVIAIDCLGSEFLSSVATGDVLRVEEDGTVTIL